jgi:hypothetical protein
MDRTVSLALWETKEMLVTMVSLGLTGARVWTAPSVRTVIQASKDNQEIQVVASKDSPA